MKGMYKVEIRVMGLWVFVDYCDTLTEAEAISEGCADEGWLNRRILRFGEDSYSWIEIES